jgi:hypothetical protein
MSSELQNGLLPPQDEEDRERMLREVHRLRLYLECIAIQGSERSPCENRLVDLTREYERRFGPLPPIDIAPTDGPYCPPAT